MFMGRLGGKADQLGYVETDPSDRYGRFRDILGKGAMKVVYRGFDEVLGIEVAWNQVNVGDVFNSPDQLQRLYSELHLLKELDNDSIISFHHSWIDVNCRTFNFITELFTSGTLREYRKKYPRVDIKIVKNWCRQILSGLEYLHNHDPTVIHRDLKCDNIFVNGHMGKLKIGDLGLATILYGSQHAHSVIGTPEFMAPEMYEEEYNELVDIYSFGMCVIELFTFEIPYGECSNPAQIYKKVTSGKLPDAFYRIHDLEVQRFVGKCLANVSERLSAKELMLDPFLPIDLLDSPFPKDFTLDIAKEQPLMSHQTKCTNMTITGTLNEEDDTIFLKVQIANNIGHKRNIYFPFDTINDTAIEVAIEMVKELEISDLEPLEIAEMIEEEISSLIPTWSDYQPRYIFSYEEEEHDITYSNHHRFFSASSCSSSRGSLTMFSSSYNNNVEAQYFPQDDLFANDDASSQSSINSFNCLNIHCNDSSNADKHGSSLVVGAGRLSCKARANKKCTRFCPQGEVDFNKQYGNMRMDSHAHSHGHYGCPRMRRTNSFVDARRLQQQRALVKMHKERMFKTVGAIENI